MEFGNVSFVVWSIAIGILGFVAGIGFCVLTLIVVAVKAASSAVDKDIAKVSSTVQ